MPRVRRSSPLVRLLVLVVSALLTGALVLGLSSRSDLRQARQRVTVAWSTLRPPLEKRYQALDRAGEAVRDRLGRAPLAGELDRALARWRAVSDADAGASAANRLEGLAARLAAMVAGSSRLRSSSEVSSALDAVERADPRTARLAYNRSVAGYEDVRGGFPRRLVAGALGYGAGLTVEVPVKEG
jgi:hypothetical protein